MKLIERVDNRINSFLIGGSFGGSKFFIIIKKLSISVKGVIMFTQVQTIDPALIDSVDARECNFTEFYHEYFPRVYNYVYYRVNNHHDADDITSLIFFKLYEKRNYYSSDKAPLFAWVFSIARNTVTDYYRQRARCTATSLENVEDMVAVGQTPDDIAASNEIKRHLHRALASLSDRERDIIALKFWSGITNREIAKIIGLSESNIGVTLYRAMRRLRHIMEIQGVNIDEGEC